MKKINWINGIMVGLIGAFLGRVLYGVFDFKLHPERYAMQSDPWYTGILDYGVAALAALAVCALLKFIWKRRGKRLDPPPEA